MRSSARLLLCAVAAAGLAFAAKISSAAAQDGAGIVVYNAQHASLTQAWADGFTRETGIKVTLRKGSDMELANQLLQEGAGSPADVFVTENSPAMTLVDGAGLFEPLGAATLALVPDQYRPENGRWIGVAARSTVFVYNKAKVAPEALPRSIMDLAAPAWKGRWGAAPAGADFQAIVSAVLQVKGEEATLDWLKSMKANAKAYRGNSVAMKAVNAGEADGAVIYHYYYYGDRARTGENSDKVALHYFRNDDPGAFVSVSGAGVLKSSKRKEQAEAFVRWVAGKGGQAILREGDSFEYAVAVGEASHPDLEPLAKLQAPRIAVQTLNSRKVTELMRAAGLL
jgi:iron(III) transport system substrate-binding protein